MPEQAERRGAPRYAVVMDAEITDLLSHTVMKVRCSDIGLSGCYLDTLNPIEPLTPLWIRMTHGERAFEVQGRVAYMVPRLGMGVQFAQPIPEEEFATLKRWIEEAAALCRPASPSFGMSALR